MFEWQRDEPAVLTCECDDIPGAGLRSEIVSGEGGYHIRKSGRRACPRCRGNNLVGEVDDPRSARSEMFVAPSPAIDPLQRSGIYRYRSAGARTIA